MIMEIGLWLLSFFLMAIETWGSVYFFDTFMERKRMERLERSRYIALYLSTVTVSFLGEYLDSMVIKALLVILVYTVFCKVYYWADWQHCIFFSSMNYSMLFLADLLSLQIESILIIKNEMYVSELTYLILPAKLVWICLIFILRKIWKGKNNYDGLSHKEWWKFGMMPLFTATAMLLMYYCYSSDKKVQASYLFLTVGLIVMNFLVMELMQDILEKGELLRESALTDQKKESQLAYYRDMQTVYERQGRKMHDYKNQIRTIQVLIREGDPQAAATLVERLTESILVEMSAVNTNHPVVNAVLNQKFHLAREQGTSMIFKVGDMSGMRLNEEETVILLSNLLDNAIEAAGEDGRLSIKLDEFREFRVGEIRNSIQAEQKKKEGHMGLGLGNVRNTLEKYHGTMKTEETKEEFQVRLMLPMEKR